MKYLIQLILYFALTMSLYSCHSENRSKTKAVSTSANDTTLIKTNLKFTGLRDPFLPNVANTRKLYKMVGFVKTDKNYGIIAPPNQQLLLVSVGSDLNPGKIITVDSNHIRIKFPATNDSADQITDIFLASNHQK